MDQPTNPQDALDPSANQLPPADPPAFPTPDQPPLPDGAAAQPPLPDSAGSQPPAYDLTEDFGEEQDGEQQDGEGHDVPEADRNPYGTPDTIGGVLEAVEVCEHSKQWGMFAHLSGIFTGFIGPLIIWQIKKDELPFASEQAKEALNFQITMAILYIIGIVTSIIFIGLFLILAVMIFTIVTSIIGGLKANSGEHYSYPIIFRFIS